MNLIWEGERAPLAKALVAAQKATESVKKAASNPAFKSKYADLAHVVEGVVPALNNAGVAVIQSPGFDGDLVTITTVLLHESGASLTGTLALKPSKTDPQGVGSAVTYGRRYALLSMTGAAPEDDDGNAASGPVARRAPPVEPREAAPSAAPVDRTLDVLPAPSGEDPKDWEAWRRVVAKKIKAAPSKEAVLAVQSGHAAGIAACAAILPDTVERMATFVSERLETISGETFPEGHPHGMANGNGHAEAH